MPNKYEREIEEILRNLERSEPRAGFGRKSSERMRRKPGVRRSMPAFRLNFSEWCLVTACVAALAAGGWAYAHEQQGDTITGILALVGFVCVAIIALSPFISARQRSSPSSGRYSNVTPMRSNPFRRLGTRWHLLVLKLRYRRQRDQK